MSHLGLPVYQWTLDSQNRFLYHCLSPVIQDLRREGLVSRFWFERMDTRGPHIFAPITVANGATVEVSQRLSTRIGDYLAANPCTAVLSPADLARSHRLCRGKLQGAADRLGGFAENNTFSILDHEERGYPFHLSEGLAVEEELWELLTELTLWFIDELAQPEGARQARAARWFAALDREVRSRHASAERYWRYHATTLLVHLEQRLAREEDRVLSQLPSAISERNRGTFTRMWNNVDGDGPVCRWIEPIVRIVLDSPQPAEIQRFALLREIIHCGLKQLGLVVNLHLPLVLFAWNRSLLDAAAPVLAADS